MPRAPLRQVRETEGVELGWQQPLSCAFEDHTRSEYTVVDAVSVSLDRGLLALAHRLEALLC